MCDSKEGRGTGDCTVCVSEEGNDNEKGEALQVNNVSYSHTNPLSSHIINALNEIHGALTSYWTYSNKNL